MNKSIFTYLFLLIGLFIISCRGNKEDSKVVEVRYSGALKTIMSGDIQSVIELDSLSKLDNLYALGAAENLKGEIQIFNGQPSNSSVKNGSIVISDSFDQGGSLLVYACVKEWEEQRIDGNLNKKELEALIYELAKEQAINVEKPFSFLLEGAIGSLDWHVIDWEDGDTVHSHEKHKNSGLNGTLQNEEVQIIGFYSTKHKTIFTHHTTNMHMHFKTNDNKLAGHIDDLNTSSSITLKLPKQ
ncbi:acetolactate decarboxylase [Mangrovimonas sp. ST2L15]|uniref:acetolactate decarboxylase n=1 Tax=Mangrovimonas sp. ST2L15 TaxID=1645916 RepID=UPI0006B5C625|nr:acetolactate decarboxylase [Mangrovimonas sp. ST2L15]